MLTKSDFLLYCEAPRHLWARIHGQLNSPVSAFDQHLIEQGYEIESLAREYLETILLPTCGNARILWQPTFSDGPYEARCDALVEETSPRSYDLYEIKSGTAIDKKNLYDIAFQASILVGQIRVDHFYLLHPNKEYTCQGSLDLARFFSVEEVTPKIMALLPEVETLRRAALATIQVADPASLAHCLAPKECPCPGVCHPALPDFSIYDIPRLSQQKKLALLAQGILQARDIPDSFELNEKQREVARMAQTGQAHIDRPALRAELGKLVYPLYFLDYETCISAIPLFDGYHPQQQIVFQYSLHRMDQPGGETVHSGFISIDGGDPSIALLHHLSGDIGSRGTILVWNKAFEKARNTEMAELHPGYAAFLEDVNRRIYDLSDIVNQGYYLDPGFKGSWSIKNVLPAMVPALSYQGMSIHQGDQASLAWWAITFGHLGEAEIGKLTDHLAEYCQMDTLAMVEIYKKLNLACRL